MSQHRMFCTYVCWACDFQWFMNLGEFEDKTMDCLECTEENEPACTEDIGEAFDEGAEIGA